MASLLSEVSGDKPISNRRGFTLVNVPDDRPERAFDQAIAVGDIDEAQLIINQLADDAARRVASGFYPVNLWRIAAKELSMPLYRRELADQRGEPQPDFDDLVGSVHQDAVKLLEFLVAMEANQTEIEGGNIASDLVSRMRGDTAEATVFDLMTNQITGVFDDEFNIFVAGARDEHSSKNDRRARGLRKTIDLVGIHRPTQTLLPTQVKRTPNWKEKGSYSSSVIMVYLSELVINEPRSIRSLQDAIIASNHRALHPREVQRIEVASTRLRDIYYQRIGEQTLKSAASS